VLELDKSHTQRAAEGATEAELNRRGISTSRTYGNEPGIDFIAIHSDGRLFPVEVKGQRQHNDWFVEPLRQDAIHIFVLVPTNNVDRPGVFRFFIMTSSEVKEAMEGHAGHPTPNGNQLFVGATPSLTRTVGISWIDLQTENPPQTFVVCSFSFGRPRW